MFLSFGGTDPFGMCHYGLPFRGNSLGPLMVSGPELCVPFWRTRW